MKPDDIPSTPAEWNAGDLNGRTFRVFLGFDEPTLGEFAAKDSDDSDPRVKLHFKLRGPHLCWLDLDDYADLGAIKRLPENDVADFELSLNQMMSKKLIFDCYGSPQSEE